MLNLPLLVTLVILVVAAGLFLSDRFSPDLIAMVVTLSLGISGVLSSQEVFSGFSRSAVITIISVFILAEGLKRSGVTDQVGQILLRIARAQEWRLVITVMIAGSFLSLFMNNIAAASMLLPAVMGAARKSQVRPSRLLMPLAFATILGGMATLLTSTNIIASSLLRDHQLQGFGLLDFARLGIPLVVGGILYMVFWGRRLLPERGFTLPPSSESDLLDVYRLGERLLRVRILDSSSFIGLHLADCHFRDRYGMNVVALERAGQMILSLSPDITFQKGDILLLEGRAETLPLDVLKSSLEVLPSRDWGEQDLESQKIAVVEAVLAPRSSLIGQTLQTTHFREKYGMLVLAIWREGRPYRSGLGSMPLQFGDALLLQGPRERLRALQSDPDLIVLNGEEAEKFRAPRGSWLAVFIMLTSLTLSIIFPSLIAEIMLGGAVLMVFSRLLSMDQAYRAIEWRSVFIIAGILPLGIAITKTGAALLFSQNFIKYFGPLGSLATLAGLFLLTTALTQIMNGAAVCAVMVPIAIQTAQSSGMDPRSLAMGVTLATSMAFITPLGHPVNVLVMSPAGYRFRDYLRVGLPLAVILFTIIIVLLPLFWPLFPR